MSDDGRFAFTAPVVMSHPHLFAAQAFKRNGKESGEPKYGASLVLDREHPDLAPLKALAMKIGKAKWPTRDLGAEYKAGMFKFPFSDGTKLADQRKAKSGKNDGDYQRGKIVIAARSKYRPNLAVIEGGRIIDLENEDLITRFKSKFFFGAEVFPQVNLVAYEGGNGPDGVTAYLNMILATGKGTKIAGGGASAAEVFKGYVGAMSAEDPTAGLDDEIPF